ncbi:hypothetical protein ACFGVR_21930 [Mucilaginibacter sp. AW1-3]
MDKIDHLESIYKNRINDEAIVFEKIKEIDNIYFFVPSLEGTNLLYAIRSIYIEHDYLKAKNLFYKAAAVADFMYRKFDRRVIDSGLYQMSYALLSDNKDLIDRYSVMKNPINHETGIGYQLPNAMQNILLDQWDKLDWNIHCLERFVKMPRFNSLTGVVDVLNGFKQKDAGLLEEGLKQLLSTYKKRREGDPLIYKFFSIDTSGFTKLAWIKGYQIDLKTPLVPIELMPVNQLEHYETYDFLNEYL